MASGPSAGAGASLSTRDGYALLAVPEDDALFARVVRGRVGALRSAGGFVRTARAQLRERYPSADLHRQREVLVDGTPTEVWFAFRDGRLSPVAPAGEWWRRRSTARAIVEPCGQLSHINAPARALLGIPAGRPAVPNLGDLVPPGLHRELVDQLAWRTLRGPVTSTTPLLAADGRVRNVEFHLTPDGAGPRRHQLSLRSFDERDEDHGRRAIAASSLRLVSPRRRAELLAMATRRVMIPGEYLAASIAGEPWVALVVSGIVRLYLGTNTLEATLVYGDHGALMGTHLTTGDGSITVGLQSVTPAVILQISARQVEQVVAKDAAFARAVAREDAVLLREVVLGYASRTAANLPQRLARELLKLADLQPDLVLLRVTEQQLADGVGSIRESIGRTIADFRRRSWLVTTRHGVIVLDRPALRGMAGQTRA